MGDVVERLEWDERKEPDSPAKRMKQVTRRTALTGGAAGIAAIALQACGGSSQQDRQHRHGHRDGVGTSSGGSGAAASIFGPSPKYHFVVRQPRDDQPVLHPDAERRQGCLQAAGLLATSGRARRQSTSAEMVNAINTAVTAKADGIAVALIVDRPRSTRRSRRRWTPASRSSPTTPTRRQTSRLAYIGQDLYVSGVADGRSTSSASSRRGEIALFIATPGSLNIQPRIDGARGGAQEPLGDQVRRRRHRRRGRRRSSRRSTRGRRSTAAPRACSPSMPAARRASAQTMQKQGLHAKGWQWRRLRPHPDHRRSCISHGITGLHDRPAALPAGLPADPASSTCTR